RGKQRRMPLAAIDGPLQLAHRIVELAFEVQRDRFGERFADPFFLPCRIRPRLDLSVDSRRRGFHIGPAQIPLIHVLVLSHAPKYCAPKRVTTYVRRKPSRTGVLGAKPPALLSFYRHFSRRSGSRPGPVRR